jgi:nucleoside-diphosphate-sugar epimerase
MARNILLTGVSGYLGGTLLHEWKTSGPSNHGTISALDRNDEQAREVAKHGVEPLIIPLKDEEAIIKALVHREITIVYYLIGSYWLESQLYFIKGLAEVRKKTGHDVHFLYVRFVPPNISAMTAARVN